jgi:hypothetical protein
MRCAARHRHVGLEHVLQLGLVLVGPARAGVDIGGLQVEGAQRLVAEQLPHGEAVRAPADAALAVAAQDAAELVVADGPGLAPADAQPLEHGR